MRGGRRKQSVQTHRLSTPYREIAAVSAVSALSVAPSSSRASELPAPPPTPLSLSGRGDCHAPNSRLKRSKSGSTATSSNTSVTVRCRRGAIAQAKPKRSSTRRRRLAILRNEEGKGSRPRQHPSVGATVPPGGGGLSDHTNALVQQALAPLEHAGFQGAKSGRDGGASHGRGSKSGAFGSPGFESAESPGRLNPTKFGSSGQRALKIFFLLPGTLKALQWSSGQRALKIKPCLNDLPGALGSVTRPERPSGAL